MGHRTNRLVAALALGMAAHAAIAGGTLTVCTQDAPEGFDVVQYELAVTNDASGVPLYDQLLRFKPGSTELLPGIAERWAVSEDGRVYTLQLRKGVKFHSTPWFKPTRELNADDVVFSLLRMHDKSHPAHAAAPHGYVYWSGMEMSSVVKQVERLDAHAVRITLQRPDAAFLSNLALPTIGSVYPAEYAESLRRQGQLGRLNTHPVGSGPFIFRSYQKDAVVRYAANKAWWGGAPAIDHLVFAITVDGDTRAQRVKAGECLVGIDMKAQAVAGFRDDPAARIVVGRPLLTTYLALNTRQPLLGDARLRQALWMAIDKKTHIDTVYAGLATPAASFLPPDVWSHDATLKDRRDPERARQLVRASGYDGRELVLFFAPGNDRLRTAELLQSDWAKVGIRVRLRALETGELFKRAGAGEHDIALLSWYGDNGDPDNFFTPNLSCAAIASGGNKARWCHQRFDGLLQAARGSLDRKQRTALYVEAQRLLHEEASIIPLAYGTTLTAVNKRVRGFVPSPFASHDFRAVSLD